MELYHDNRGRILLENEAISAARNRRSWTRYLRRALLFVAVAYVGILLLLLALESQFIFHPVTAEQSWQPPPDDSFQDISLTTSQGDRIHAWWIPRSGGNGVILYAHGNAGNLSHRGPAIKRWGQELNCATLIFDYPGYGKSTGKPTEAGCYAAADAAWDWLINEQKVDEESVILVGASLGASLAIDLAHKHTHRALVVLKGFTSIPDMASDLFPWLPARYFVRTKFDNLSKIAECNGPVFFLHARNDSIIPYRHTERLFEAAKEPKEFFTQESGDHNSALPAEFFHRLKLFLEKHASLR